ncbi:MAG TPA: o-succinylbenzoate--CoA ligase [Ktedonobacteraceae bacterium]|nr:o-succinylbenzoate--CoA ligase [Ktedonobacteraceae bacterium]
MTPDIQLSNWLTRSAENFPQRLAIQCGDVQWSFAEMERQVTRLARQLATLGVQHRSCVALLANNGLPYVACVHALTRLGAILVPLNTRLTTDELRWQLQDVHAAFLLNDSQHEARVREIELLSSATLIVERGNVLLPGIAESTQSLQPLIDLNATQAIMYTSGTTGNPKGVLITYGMQWWNALGSALNLGHQPDDCWLACMPLFHIGGLSILMRSVIYGISVVLQEKFDAAVVNRAIHEDRVSIISVVATMLQRMLADLDAHHAHYPAALRCVLLGGGPAPRPLLEECARRTIPVVQTYGLTESCSQAVTLSPADALRKLGSAGRPLLPVQLRIIHEEREALAGEAGTIYLKGPTITPGYADRPQATYDAFRDGWLSTGDVGYLDEEGYLYVLDRRNDLIISGGENVYPAEIEAVFLSHPDVEEAGVSGRADPQWGQVPVAYIHLRPGRTTDAATLLDYARSRLARYKLPHAIYLVAALPRNSAGKLQRRELHTLSE